MMPMTDMVKHLLIINIIFFVGSFLVPEATEILALHYFESDKFRLWQPITHMFMHGGLMHIFFNMFALVSFGSALEHFWGGKKFLFFYFSCGIGAALVHSAVNYYGYHQGLDFLVSEGINKSEIVSLLAQEKFDTRWQEMMNPSDFTQMIQSYIGKAVGASGAVYGLLVAFAFMFPNAELALMFIPIPIKAKYFVPGLLLIDLYLGLNGGSLFGGGTGIAHFAHLGGALFGFIMMWYWKKNQFDNNRWDR
ncbi:rhomboid family intramembrane serine protease [Flavobacterium tibetense]|uniref:Rhomboid family intramembrane serine protease n=1 Tax=Flavobacterium tibetense TaxID=2233533 RepID=A0A365P2I9_9FLAO|nr:rhomboid family intramembrane serine protease [Flavobacterium tibetense]RBA28752.1 rhomboid family intramembrane serine protease [Flavobacterium tibetense]